MLTDIAQLPVPPAGHDRIFQRGTAIAVLDGATPLAPYEEETEDYVNLLGREIIQNVTQLPWMPLRKSVADAISNTAIHLGLRPGHSPSSTVAIVRWDSRSMEVLTLGDTLVILGTAESHDVILDDRLAKLRLPERESYRSRLALGKGFDNTHRQLLKEVRRRTAGLRNRSHGFYIAEADPTAAESALTRTVPVNVVSHFLIATDGVYETLRGIRPTSWHAFAMSNQPCRKIIAECYNWEDRIDPNGLLLPRAKRHDDKTLVRCTL